MRSQPATLGLTSAPERSPEPGSSRDLPFYALGVRVGAMSAKLDGPTPPIVDGETAEKSAKEKSPSPRPRRRWRRWLWGIAIATPIAVGVLWILVHRIPWMGPLVANTLRSVIGVDNVAKLEDFVYSIEDRVNRTVKSDEAPKTYWQVPAPTAPVVTPPTPTEVEAGKPAPLAPFSPPEPGPVFADFGAPGDGKWVPMIDPRRPEEPPRLMKTLLHPDKSRAWAELFVVAVDLRQVEVKLMSGYQEPRTDKKEAEGYVRKSKIPEEHWGALLGAFNGGFMAEHGHYGFRLDGITFIDPREDSCTLAHFSDGSYRVETWKKMADKQSDMLWFRQAPICMFEDGEIHPSLKGAHQRKWGATLDGNTVIRRSAVGMSADKQILYVGITNHTTAKVLAIGMHHAGALNVAQMDVNWSYPKFVTYQPDKQGILRPIALAEGFEFNEHLYLRERSMRDFFYLVRKEEMPKEEGAKPAAADAPKPTDAPPQDAPKSPEAPSEKP